MNLCVSFAYSADVIFGVFRGALGFVPQKSVVLYKLIPFIETVLQDNVCASVVKSSQIR